MAYVCSLNYDSELFFSFLFLPCYYAMMKTFVLSSLGGDGFRLELEVGLLAIWSSDSLEIVLDE